MTWAGHAADSVARAAQRRVGRGVLPYGLDTLQLAGKERRQFVLKGPLLAATGSLTPVAPAGCAIGGPRCTATLVAASRSPMPSRAKPVWAGRGAVRRTGRRAGRFSGEAGRRRRAHRPARHSVGARAG